ncbi:bifunctional adenosylcobinamide kinase/adenosylcobinamide-phosphate guanylyltransferase [Acetoanaerobium noterae]|uniref:bifunctional adenosylcobinamide kinase/adenosylcobinamide-phosphate guanylyltransferase n=1 Tax=Acetoanaerobium noterae TaxID=745369 RepID=UPI0028B00DE7|nr:bifunctional adenosylcobinamide kinase/adenosylcobinamide-phosphate guanylyltransferase [Acetoanaerobium noterae]
MHKVILVTGGARSGKSYFAEQLCKNIGEKVSYLATSEAFDDEMKARVAKHKEQRPSSWKTYEAFENLKDLVPDMSSSSDTVILDCITVMANNLIFHSDVDIENATQAEIDSLEKRIQEELVSFILALKYNKLNLVMVTNELGMGIVPENKLSRIYRDIIGRINQVAARYSDEVYFVVSGISQKIKG